MKCCDLNHLIDQLPYFENFIRNSISQPQCCGNRCGITPGFNLVSMQLLPASLPVYFPKFYTKRHTVRVNDL